ncbi:hypothetical protein [Actinoplanes sp. NPDC049316]|uniref:hypothetical protein n=1 Tax=Actinoplanes sp. NPDC049316 TaxID=3154727 RepID=UPI00342E9780
MEYTVGEAVVFGTDGATRVRGIVTHEAAGKTWTRLELGYPFDAEEPEISRVQANHGCLAPLDQVLGRGGVPAVLEELSGPVPDEDPTTWGTVWETYWTMIGGITADAGYDEMPAVLEARQVARTVRNLTARGPGLDPQLARLLVTARQVLISEIALGAGMTRQEAEAAIDEALSGS